MSRRPRTTVVLALLVALGSSAVALGSGADENIARVDGKVSPKKLFKKKFKRVNLFLGVRNSSHQVDGTQSNPVSELISVSKNVRVRLGRAPRCRAPLANGMPTGAARRICPRKSFLGRGKAEVTGPGASGPQVIATPRVAVFNGPGRNELRLHTYSPDLGSASPVVDARIVRAPGRAFGKALSVPVAPETGALMITKFNAKIIRKRGVTVAKCKPRRIKYRREVTYKDGSSERVVRTQRCKRKRR